MAYLEKLDLIELIKNSPKINEKRPLCRALQFFGFAEEN